MEIDREAGILIGALRHRECGVTGPCEHRGSYHVYDVPWIWCERAGEWLAQHGITGQQLNEWIEAEE